MDQNEFVLLTTPIKDKMFRLAKRLLVSIEEAQDATQEILVKLWSKKGTLNDYNNVEAFAMTMTKNYCLDQLKSKRAGNIKISSTDYPDREPALDKNLEDRDSLHWIEKSINELPAQQQIIIQLRDIEQYEFDEMAKILDLSEGTIRVALSRARKTVREYMMKTYDYGIKQNGRFTREIF